MIFKDVFTEEFYFTQKEFHCNFLLVIELRFGDIVMVLQMQPHPYHLLRAHKFREHFEEQISSLPKVGHYNM